MQKIIYLVLLTILCSNLFAQKQVFIPTEFNDDPYLKNYSMERSYQSDNFVLFWGPIVGTDPKNYSNSELSFDPKTACDTLERLYKKYIKEYGFCSDAATTNLGKYKIILIVNETWGTGGPSGWAFGGSYDNTIGAMWLHPKASTDYAALSHEFAHSLQSMIGIQENKNGGFTDNDMTGFFWECHANFMRCQVYPQFAPVDLPRWLGTSNFQWSSTRHHYDSYHLLFYMEQLGGIAAVNNLWKKSVSGEHPLMTYQRLKGWTQSQLNNFIYDYAKREVTYDYTVNNFGTILRAERDRIANEEPHYLWRYYTILNQVDASGRYVVSDYSAPQDYGYNIIPLYPTCASRKIQVKFKGHTETTTGAGWRYGFVAVKANGSTVTYSTTYSSNEKEISYQMAADDANLYLVVLGAPTVHTTYVWEPGWPKVKRFPYELKIENAVPEGYQTNFRGRYKTNGHVHANGGGWVANTATVESSVYVGPQAVVLGNASVKGNVRITGTAWVEDATISDNVSISGNANVWSGRISGSVTISDNALINNCTVSENAVLKGNVMEWGVTLSGNVVVGGDAEIGNCTSGVYLQTPHPNNGRDDCDKKGADDSSNKDINASYSLFSAAQMNFTKPLGCTKAALENDEATINKYIEVYPNPTSDFINVKLINFESEKAVSVSLYSLDGKLMYNKNISGLEIITIPVESTFENEAFVIVKVTDGNNEFVHKVKITKHLN